MGVERSDLEGNNTLSPLSPQTWPFSLELLPQPAYMVGGAVRDALLGRQSEYLDLDFVLPSDAVQTARQIANHYQAGFVLLDAERQIARVVFKQGTADFAQQEGSIETDLKRRDFTVNAIAYNPHTTEIIDPLQGIVDLQQRVIRMISPANLQDDPLRLLRAYRQAAQLGFTLDPSTQSMMRQLSPLLGQVSAERVQAELRYLLRIPQGTPWLIAASQDGVLSPWFPNTDTQNRLSLLENIDRSFELLIKTWSQLEIELSRQLRDTINISWLAIAKLVMLLPPTPEEAEQQMLRLTYSNAEIRAVTIVLKYLPQLQEVTISEMPLSEQYFFFQGVGAVFPTLAVLAVATGKPVNHIAPLINRYLNLDDQVAHPTSLVTGKDLMKALNLPSGPQVGQLLALIQLARIEDRISTPIEALEFAAQVLDKGNVGY